MELPIPISPNNIKSESKFTERAPISIASQSSDSLIASFLVKSAVGVSKAIGTTFKSAPFTSQSWFIAAPPALKFSTICFVTSWGKGFTP